MKKPTEVCGQLCSASVGCLQATRRRIPEVLTCSSQSPRSELQAPKLVSDLTFSWHWKFITCSRSSSENDTDVSEDHASSTMVSNEGSMLLSNTSTHIPDYTESQYEYTYFSSFCNFIVNPIGVTRLMTLQDVGVAVERVASCSVVWKSRRQAILT
jgi:hypothetical protein